MLVGRSGRDADVGQLPVATDCILSMPFFFFHDRMCAGEAEGEGLYGVCVLYGPFHRACSPHGRFRLTGLGLEPRLPCRGAAGCCS